MPIRLDDISSTAWEHPADRAALNALRALPGFDAVVRRVAGFFGERGIRQLFLANAVRVGPTQYPALWAGYQEMLRALDWPGAHAAPGASGRVPELYVTQTPFVNAGAVGFADPFIILNTASVELLEPEEQRFLLAHEIGHIASGHVTYNTIAIILLTLGLNSLPAFAGLALLPFRLALLEWYRKAELSCDRAGVLGVQDPRVAYRAFLKLAGGARRGTPGADVALDLDAYLAQAAEYEAVGSAWDRVLQVLATAQQDHPFHTVRVGELQRWVQGGDYARILAGDYARRADAPRPLGDDVGDAADYYGEQVRQATASVREAVERAADAFAGAVGDAFRGRPWG
ncbi:MAG TPA: M48 family metallopeptidase [Gemmatirosa sp.]